MIIICIICLWFFLPEYMYVCTYLWILSKHLIALIRQEKKLEDHFHLTRKTRLTTGCSISIMVPSAIKDISSKFYQNNFTILENTKAMPCRHCFAILFPKDKYRTSFFLCGIYFPEGFSGKLVKNETIKSEMSLEPSWNI